MAGPRSRKGGVSAVTLRLVSESVRREQRSANLDWNISQRRLSLCR